MFSALSACDSTADVDPGNSAPASPRLVIHPLCDPRRREGEAVMYRIDAQCCGAEVRQCAPELASLRDDSRIRAAAGCRSALQGSMLLERYVGSPIASLMDRVEDLQDQAELVHAARAFFRLYGDLFRSLPLPSGAVTGTLARAAKVSP